MVIKIIINYFFDYIIFKNRVNDIVLLCFLLEDIFVNI